MNTKISKIICCLFLFAKIVFAQDGIVKSYYPDHKIKSEISYVNDILDGTSFWYYQNGKLMTEKTFSKGILNGWIREYHENGNLKSEFFVNNGIKDGDEKLYNSSGVLLSILSFHNGQQINKQIFENVPLENEFREPEKKVEVAVNQTINKPVKAIEPNIEAPANKNEIIKAAADQKANIKSVEPVKEKEEKTPDIFTQPSMINSVQSLQEKIVYPADALKFGLEGIVTLMVYINEKGQPSKSEILKGIGLGCDEEAARLVNQASFIAATKNGKPIESQMTLDIHFNLPHKKQEIVKEEPQKVEIQKETRKYEENLSVLCEADRCPRPEDDMATIYSLFQIPNVAKALKLKGMILIEGIVDKAGNFTHSKIIDGVGYGCDQLVETALQKSKFTPGIKKGEPIETKILINFPFSYDR